jgi:DNA-binding GntR family transcriptional regulator
MKSEHSGPVTVTDYVANGLRERILNGTYAPGSKLDQQTLTREFSASLIPVRESLRQLEVEGLVQIQPHRGAFVAELSIDDLKEIYFVREVLEEAATRLAVPKMAGPILDQLGKVVLKLERSTQDQDFAQLLELNRTFHFSIYEACGNSLLLEMIGGLWDRSRRYRQLYTYLPERAPQTLAEHKAIYAACRDGHAAVAGAEVRNNVRQTTEGILARLQLQGTPS